jgi:hypothetical protein
MLYLRAPKLKNKLENMTWCNSLLKGIRFSHTLWQNIQLKVTVCLNLIHRDTEQLDPSVVLQNVLREEE